MLRDLFSLFPAHAGVILFELLLGKVEHTFPRTCGGDPKGGEVRLVAYYFSPHMRG